MMFYNGPVRANGSSILACLQVTVVINHYLSGNDSRIIKTAI